jgi:glycerol-3-phosphate acyltransferase PlsY
MTFAHYLILLLAYLLGSIPTGKIIVWKVKGLDIQKQGSGNIGTTNVSRILGRNWGIAVFFLDVLKGLIPTYLALYLFQDLNFALFAGLFATLGHIFSVFLKFKGGKGVATSVGVFFAIAPILILSTAFFQLIILKIFRVMSLATFAGLLAMSILVYIFQPLGVFYILLVFDLLIIFAHRENIKRIIKGKELKI